MTTETPPPGERQRPTPEAAGSATCSSKQEQQRGFPIDVRRMMGIDVAAKLVGAIALADEMNGTVRSLNYKINGERGVSDDDLLAAVRLIERRAAKLLAHAYKLRSIVSAPAAQSLATPVLAQVATVLAHCDHVERFGYERTGQGPDASPHLLATEARRLTAAIISESTKTGAPA